MSLTLDPSAIMAPHHNQLIEGGDPRNPYHYSMFAYRHKHGLTWFGGTRRDDGRLQHHGGYVHYIQSAIKNKAIPTKMDQYVAAINFDVYMDLVRKEYGWWEDYDRKMAELLAANPGTVERDHTRPAAKYAHRELARREGRLAMIPANFDTIDYDVGDAGDV